MLNTHCSQQLKREGKAELALVDPVDKHLDVHHHALLFKPAGEVLVGDVFLIPKGFDDGLGARFVKLALIHSEYMVFNLRASYRRRFRFALNNSYSIYV